MQSKSFWSEGIRFECQGSGRCCVSRGSYGYVYLTLEDRRALARKLRITTRAFTARYCAKHNGYFHLRDTEGPCQFLQGKAHCSVYEARPAQCRTWPFWPENMNARTWSREVARFCPGVGKGKLHTREEILSQLAQDPIG